MKNEALQILLEVLEKRYGDIHSDRGCYLNGEWFSLLEITTLIENVDESF